MKLLLTFATRMYYKPTVKTLEQFETFEEEETYNDLLVAFIHAEEHDQEDLNKVEKKLVKNIKWACKKNNTKNVMLHSFAHLSNSKASPEFTKELFDKAQKRLENAEYKTWQTPFGYFLDLSIDLPGKSQARIFKSF